MHPGVPGRASLGCVWMTGTPEFDDFKTELRKLKTHKLFKS